MPTYNLADNGDTPTYTATGDRLWLKIDGDFGDGTATIQIDIAGGSEFTSDASCIVAESFGLSVPVGTTVRVSLADAVLPDLNVEIFDSVTSINTIAADLDKVIKVGEERTISRTGQAPVTFKEARAE